MKEYIKYFIGYITTERDAAKSTVHHYKAVLHKFQDFLFSDSNIANLNSIKPHQIRSYLTLLKESYNYKFSSLAHKINVIKHFFGFLPKQFF